MTKTEKFLIVVIILQSLLLVATMINLEYRRVITYSAFDIARNKLEICQRTLKRYKRAK